MGKAKSILTNTYFLITALIAGIIATIYLFHRYKLMQEDRKVTIDAINAKLDAGIGAEGDAKNSVTGILFETLPDPRYYGGPDAEALQAAIGHIWDDDEKVFSIIKGKTKAKLKSIENALKNLYGYGSWDDYLNKVFDVKQALNPFKDFSDTNNCIGTDCGKFTKAMNMISSAK